MHFNSIMYCISNPKTIDNYTACPYFFELIRQIFKIIPGLKSNFDRPFRMARTISSQKCGQWNISKNFALITYYYLFFIFVRIPILKTRKVTSSNGQIAWSSMSEMLQDQWISNEIDEFSVDLNFYYLYYILIQDGDGNQSVKLDELS